MNRTSKRIFTSLALALLTLAATLNPFSARAQSQVIHGANEVDNSGVVFSPCAGEEIQFTGSYHVAFTLVTDAQGVTHYQLTANDHDFRGVGLTSGKRYRRVGATHNSYRDTGTGPFVLTITDSFHFIGQGAGNNTLLSGTYHITINANGQMTASVDRFSVVCR